MYKYYHKLLPPVFNDFFIDVHAVHNYNTRLSSKKSYYLPKARTNYGLFNIHFLGTKTWNNIDETVKLFSFHKFKKRLKDLRLYRSILNISGIFCELIVILIVYLLSEMFIVFN